MHRAAASAIFGEDAVFDAWFWWAVLGLVLVGAETFIPGLAVIFFGLGAFATALLCAIPPFAANSALQGLFWTVASVASLVLLRRKFKKFLRGTVFYRGEDEEVDTLAGEEATVTEAISPDSPGRVRFRGTSWKALAYLESFAPGDVVRVVSREGLALVVTRDFLAPGSDEGGVALPSASNGAASDDSAITSAGGLDSSGAVTVDDKNGKGVRGC